MLTTLALSLALSSPAQVASPERQRELLDAIHARNAQRAAASAPAGSRRIIGVETLPPGFVGPPRPIYSAPAIAAPAPAPRRSTGGPSALERKRAGRRAFQARAAQQEAAQAAEAQRQYQRNLPLMMEAQRQQQNAQMRMYEAQLRHRENLDFNDAIRGVTRPNR